MRVLVVSAWDPRRPTDGSSLVLLHHLRHLADRHDLTVLTPDTNPPAEGVEVPVPVTPGAPPVQVPLSRVRS